MKKLSLCLAAAFGLCSTHASAQSQDQLITSMKKIGVAWTQLAQSNEPLVVSCPTGGFQSYRVRPGSSVSYDLRKTDSMLNPLQGVVVVTGDIESNSSQQDGSCLPTVEAARSQPTYRTINMNYTLVMIYQAGATGFSLSSGNQLFINRVGHDLMLAVPGASTNWKTALTAIVNG